MAKKIFKGIGKVAKAAVGGILGTSIGGKKKKAADPAAAPADGKGPIITPLAANDPRIPQRPGLGSTPTILSSDYTGTLLPRSNRLGS